MNKLITNITFLLLVVSSFTTWLAINEYLRLNIFLLLCIGILNVVFYRYTKPFVIQKNTKPERLFICLFLLIVTFSFVINYIFNYQPKIFSNYIATIFIFFLLYFYYSSVIQNYLSIEKCIKGLAYGGILLLIIITTDSLLVNFTEVELRSYFIWGYEGNTDYFRRSVWISTSSPTEEPGITALYLNILFPFTLYYLNGWKRIICCILFLFCILSLFSSAGIVMLFTGILFISFLKSSVRTQISFLSVIAVILIFFYITLRNNEFVQTAIEQWSFIEKVTLSGETQSSSERAIGLLQAIQDGIHHPFIGQGPGYGKAILKTGYLSTYLSFLGNYGLIAFLLFMAYWGSIWRKCFKLPPHIKYYFIYAFYSVSIGALIGDQLHTFALWLLIPIITKTYNTYSKIHI